MTGTTRWIAVGALGAALVGPLIAGCGKQDSGSGSTSGTPATTASSTSPVVGTSSAGKSTPDDNMAASRMGANGSDGHVPAHPIGPPSSGQYIGGPGMAGHSGGSSGMGGNTGGTGAASHPGGGSGMGGNMGGMGGPNHSTK